MGGKRPDQHNIDPREAGSMDYKTLPQTGQGRDSVDDTVGDDLQKLGQQQVGHGGGPGQHFFDPRHPQPSHDANVHAREGHAHGGESDSMHAGEQPRERAEHGTEDPRERGIGA